jgi:hypothetical protein
MAIVRELLRLDDVKETETQAQLERRNNDIQAILQNNRDPVLLAEFRRNRRKIQTLAGNQWRATKKRREAVRAPNNGNVEIPNDIYELRDYFRGLEGRNFTFRIKYDEVERDGEGRIIRVLNNEAYRVVNIERYDPRRFMEDIYYKFFYNSNVLLPNMTQLIVVRNEDLPRVRRTEGRTTWEQVFRDNDSGTCFFDSVQKGLPLTKEGILSKNNKTFYNKLEKQKKKYPHGVKKTDIQEICDTLAISITMTTLLPIPHLIETFLSTHEKPAHRIKLINSRPHHVELYLGNYSYNPVQVNEWDSFMDSLKDEFLYLGNNIEGKTSACITKNGFFYKDVVSFPSNLFYDQLAYHTTKDTTFTQALEFIGQPLYFSTTTPLYEYDMNNAYLQYPYSYAGYLISEEEGFFNSDIIPSLLNLYENDITTMLFHVHITSPSTLNYMFNLPRDLIVPSWFLPILKDTEFYFTKFSVHKSFKIDMTLVYNEYRKSYKGPNLKQDWKQTYVKLFGMTAKKQTITKYDIKGCDDEDFFNYCQSKLDEVTNDYTFCKNDNHTYSIKQSSFNKTYCPQVLHCTTLYCYSKLYELASTLPLSFLIGKTLDSLLLSTKLDNIPDGFKEKLYTKEYEPTIMLEYPLIIFEDNLPIYFDIPTLDPIHKINYDLGQGGSGKTFTNMSKYTNAVLIVPTRKLVSEKRKEFPDHQVITYHKFMGWNRTETPLHDKRGRLWKGIALIDEITMLTTYQINQMINAHPDSILHFMGDIHENGIPYQCYFGDTPSKYVVQNPIYHTNDYRSIDEETKQFKRDIRIEMDKVFTSKTYTEYENLNAVMAKYITSYSPYTNDLQILTGSRWLCEYYTTTNKNSLNAHRVQGQTLENEYQIDLTAMSWQKFYTCLSRCRTISQIKWIRSSTKVDERWAFRDKFLNSRGSIDDIIEGEQDYDKESEFFEP